MNIYSILSRLCGKINLSKKRRRCLFHSPYVTLIFLVIFFMYYNCVFDILPALVQDDRVLLFHLCIGHFMLFNILGNLYLGMYTNTSINGKVLSTSEVNNEWRMCNTCQSIAPPRSWHCNICNVCILKRDHHCSFFAQCIGYKNHRYFIMFLFYVDIALMYVLYFNVCYLIEYVVFDSYLEILKAFVPLVSVMLDSGGEAIYVMMIVVNAAVSAFVSALLIMQIKLISKGLTEFEAGRRVKKYNAGWKSNWLQILGKRWYLIWLSPFIESELTTDGVNFPENKVFS